MKQKRPVNNGAIVAKRTDRSGGWPSPAAARIARRSRGPEGRGAGLWDLAFDRVRTSPDLDSAEPRDGPVEAPDRRLQPLQFEGRCARFLSRGPDNHAA